MASYSKKKLREISVDELPVKQVSAKQEDGCSLRDLLMEIKNGIQKLQFNSNEN